MLDQRRLPSAPVLPDLSPPSYLARARFIPLTIDDAFLALAMVDLLDDFDETAAASDYLRFVAVWFLLDATGPSLVAGNLDSGTLPLGLPMSWQPKILPSTFCCNLVGTAVDQS